MTTTHKVRIEKWHSNYNEAEHHFFLGDTYIGGVNATAKIGNLKVKKAIEIIKRTLDNLL